MTYNQDIGAGASNSLENTGLSLNGLFLGVAAAAMINAIALTAVQDFSAYGIFAALRDGGGQSWVVWIAFGLGMRSILEAPPAPLHHRDIAASVLAMAFLLWPLPQTSFAALSIFALYVYYARRDNQSLRAAAVIFFSIAIAGLWAKFVASFGERPLELLDTRMLALLTDLKTAGNLVFFRDGSGSAVMLWGCTSFANASLAFLLWVAITRSLRPKPKKGELWNLVAVFAAVLAVNSLRLYLTMQSRASYEIFHSPQGGAWFEALMLVLAMGCTFYGLRREILA